MVDMYTMLIKFPDGSQSFRDGFEAGRLDQQMQEKINIIEKRPVQKTNLEVFQNMCEAYKYKMEIVEDYGEWIDIIFTRLEHRGNLGIVK